VKDIWPGASGSQPHELVAVGSTLFFAAWDGVHGYELWRSDGTAAGTTMVRDIIPPGSLPDGAGSGSDPRWLTNVNGTLFFTSWWIDSNVQTNGIALVRSDGTAAGTRMLGNQYVVGGVSQQWFPFDLEPVNGLLYMTDGDRLGSSDGTDAGTRFFQDIYYGGDSLLEGLTNVDGALYFRALEGGLGQELWRSTGGEATMVRNIAPEYLGSNPSEITALGSTALFRGSDAASGFELWRSDGTEAGTQMIADIRAGAASSSPSALTAVGSSIYFAADDGVRGFELWRSDGTAAGTELVQDVAPGARGSGILWFARAGTTLFFSADDGTHGQELWALPLGSGGGAGDVTAPTVTLTSPAGGETVRGTLTIAADASDDTGVARVDFLVDGVAVGSDASAPYSLTWNSATGTDGVKAVAARAVDAAGNEATSAARNVTIDNTAPDTTIASGPSGLTTSRSATFAFAVSEPGATFECALDDAPYTPCSSPVSYTALADGQHTFRVRAADSLGNVDQSPAQRTWAVDATPPETTIDFGPSGSVSSRSAVFSFSANELATFQCSLDGATPAACSSPVRYDHLRKGPHTFTVRATDTAGNADPTPATRTWTAG
jgi:ELWxxDGT repeat protein